MCRSSCEKGVGDFKGLCLADDTLPHAEDVGIVVLTGCLCRECIGTDCGTDPFHLIGCDGHADARTADQDTLFKLTGGNRVRHRLCIVRVITGIRCEGSEVFIGNPSVIQMLHQHLFVLVTAMVTSYRYHSTPPKC